MARAAAAQKDEALLVGHLDALARRYLFQELPGGAEDVPLTRQEVRVLVTVGGRQQWTMGALAHELAVSMSCLTARVDRLVAKGLLRRARSESDRRVVLAELTGAGRARYERRRAERMRMAAAMLCALAPAERRTLLALMGKIRDSIARGGATAGAVRPARRGRGGANA